MPDDFPEHGWPRQPDKVGVAVMDGQVVLSWTGPRCERLFRRIMTPEEAETLGRALLDTADAITPSAYVRRWSR